MEQPTFFHDEHPIDLFAFEFDDVDFKSTLETCYSSHNNKRFYSETTQNSFPVESSPDQSVVSAARPTKHLKTKNSSPKIISFENSNTSSDFDFGSGISQIHAYDDKSFLNNIKCEKKAATTMMRNQTQARDHVIAERKRREKLTQRFIALSSILPGLKKNDKATILEDAIKHLKQLQEKVNNLEEQMTDRKVETAVFVKRSILCADDHSFSCDESIPEIEAKVSGEHILFRIHYDKHSGRTTTAILAEMEKHHLTVQSCTSLPFGNNTIDITIVAQMNKENSLSIKDLIRNISQVLRKLI